MNTSFMKWIVSLWVIFMAGRSLAQSYEVGTRGGTSFSCGPHRFYQVEEFARMDLPWHWAFDSDWLLQSRLDASLGWLGGEKTDGIIGSVGPVLELHKGAFPLVLEGGISPTFLSQDRFGERDLGDWFEFTSHAGVRWDITNHISVGLRFQHTSNAGISRHNPGLNMQMLSASYRF